MNLKQRGVTVGDLLIISLILISSIFIINKVTDTDNQSYLYINSKVMSTNIIS